MSKVTNIDATGITFDVVTVLLQLICQAIRKTYGLQGQETEAFREQLRNECSEAVEHRRWRLGLQDEKDCEALLRLHKDFEDLLDAARGF